MRFILAILFALPLATFVGCSGGGEVPALTAPTGKDPSPEDMKKYIEESKKRGSAPKNVKSAPAPGAKK